MNRKTIFSPCRQYRFTLWRELQPELRLKDGFVQFIGLNPSTADETKDDPTVRRCIRYASAWGYTALCMTNIFAFRATDPKVMRACVYPIGDAGFEFGNTKWLAAIAREAALVVCAWGTHGAFAERGNDVKNILCSAGVKLTCLGCNDDGSPKHPLYLRKDLSPVPFV